MVWLALYSFPYLFLAGQQEGLSKVIAHSWVPLSMYAMVFYSNYFVFIDRYFFPKKLVPYFIINAVLITAAISFSGFIIDTFFQNAIPKPHDNDGPPRTLFLYLQIGSYLIPLIFSIALKITERYLKAESERKEAENIKLEAELQHLKYQLQPHFFFNSLNNIYSMVDTSPEEAKATIHNLSKLMRYLLYETNTQKVSLQNEVNFLEKYIELMKLRLTENTQVNYQFDKTESSVKVVPLLFISLVENAFKHGVSATQKSTIDFSLKTTDKQLKFRTENYNFPKSDFDKSGSGIGLQNIKKRLELLYPNKHEVKFEVKDDKFIAELNIEIDG
ncbi:histidine kinase [Joostella sp. CR20]